MAYNMVSKKLHWLWLYQQLSSPGNYKLLAVQK